MVLGQCALLDGTALRELHLSSRQSADEIFLKFGRYYIAEGVRECLLNHVVTVERCLHLPSWIPTLRPRLKQSHLDPVKCISRVDFCKTLC